MSIIDPKHPKATDKPTLPLAEGPAVDDVPSLEALLACEAEAAEAVAAEAVAATEQAPAPPLRAPRGFAAMDPALVREIARRGARASHERGTAHKFTADEARAAGRKGGSAPHRVRGRGKRTGERPGA